MKASVSVTICFILLITKYAAARAVCTDGDVRLEDKESDYVGRVGLCYKGVWGSVFDREINDNAAIIVCRQLGLPNNDPKVVLQYAGAKGRVHFIQISCTGNEANLLECRNEESGYSGPGSWYGRDFGVSCAPPCTDGEVRLLRDRVQTCRGQRWGYVCYDRGWTRQDAQVVCRELGFSPKDALVDYHIFVFGQHTFPYFVNKTNCTGSEGHLLDCPDVNETLLCGSVTAPKAYCSGTQECNGTQTVRLQKVVKGLENYGRLEVCYEGYWGSVCDDSLHHSEVLPSALVACKELGYSKVMKAEFTPIGRTFYSLPSIPIVLDDIRCAGDETSLLDCPKSIKLHNCISWEDVLLHCRERECNNTDVHLVGERTSLDGEVEVCRNHLWMPVCSDSWDEREAQVVCTQLGYKRRSYALKQYELPNPTQGVNILPCYGNETLLTNCNYEITECTSRAAVLCTDTTCEEDGMRLVGGHSVKEGRVQMCREGEWHSVCGDSWSESGAEARTVCATLGYIGDSVTAGFGRDHTPLLPMDIQCNGVKDELNLCIFTNRSSSYECKKVASVICDARCTLEDISFCTDCSGPSSICSVYDNCFCSSDCFISGECCPDVENYLQCLNVDDCETGEVRLVGGVTGSSSGVVEVCVNGVWGTVCDYNNEWTLENAEVVCLQLNLPISNVLALPFSVFGSASSGPVLFDSVHCMGTEDHLLDCPHSSVGNHFCHQEFPSTVAVLCTADCEEGEVRLRDGTHESNGRVETCQNGIWGSVCSDNMWDVHDAGVVCRQLNFTSDDVRVTKVFGREGPVLMSNVDCNGSETGLNLCPSNKFGSQPCENGTAGIICNTNFDTHNRCNDENGTPPEHWNTLSKTERFGYCEPYAGNCKLCNKIFRESIDYVFIAAVHGSQKNISSIIDSEIPPYLESNSLEDGDECYENILRVICNYYLMPCGTESVKLPPYSLCSEECSTVERDCPIAWRTAKHALENYNFISCDKTSNFIFPLPSCCTSMGIEWSNKPETKTSHVNVIGVGGGVVVSFFFLIILSVAILLLYVYVKRRIKHKRIQTVQRDILRMVEPEVKHDEEPPGHYINTTPGSNPYSAKEQPLTGQCLLKVEHPESRGRLNSRYVRELTRGKFLIRSQELSQLEMIGQGEFGVVYKAMLGPKGTFSREVAVKTLKGCFDQQEVDKFVEESLKMSRFKHIHVMGLIGVCLNDAGSTPYIVMPYMVNGCLLDYLKKERRNLVLFEEADDDQVQDVQKRLMVMCSQIASGMEYLAAEKYVHRDLAARNCMIDSHFVIKISDFGLSEDVFQRNYYREGVGGEMAKLPVKWMAPESLSDGHFSEKSDVWSFGVTMWEIFSGGKSPYPGTNPVSLMQMLEGGERMPKPYNSACSDEIYMMMLECWESAPDKRPSFKTLYTNTSKFIEGLAGYLEVGFNPFAAQTATEPGDEEATNERSEDEEEVQRLGEPVVTVKVTPPSVEP